jgi:hypothetical protein
VRLAGALNAPSGPRSTFRAGDTMDEATLIAGLDNPIDRMAALPAPIEVYPIAKKPGAPFSDMVTVGRTSNNDIVLNDVTVSRFHAYFKCVNKDPTKGGAKQPEQRWIVCDAGSKNGTKLEGSRLDARREAPIESGAVVRFGDVDGTFYTADELFEYLTSMSTGG